MSKMPSNFFILIIICWAALGGGGCGKMQLEANRKPEDEIIVLETLKEAPTGKFQDFEIGDEVAVIKNDGVFQITGQIEQVSSKLVFAATYSRGRPAKETWMPVEDARNIQGDEKSVPKGYKVRIGEGRFISYEWFPPAQIFPAPWAGAAKLKVGDTVYQNHFGDFKPDKGVITALPEHKNGQFRIRFDGSEKDEWAEGEKLFSSIEPASAEKLAAGDIVYFDKSYWTLVVGKQDGKIIIREAGFPATDKLVDISKLQILKKSSP